MGNVEMIWKISIIRESDGQKEAAIKSGKLKNTEYVNERKNCFFLM